MQYCRRAAHVRRERTEDIPKLLSYFRECKSNNPNFFYELQLDEKNVVKNVFWSHASQQGAYAGMFLTLGIIKSVHACILFGGIEENKKNVAIFF